MKMECCKFWMLCATFLIFLIHFSSANSSLNQETQFLLENATLPQPTAENATEFVIKQEELSLNVNSEPSFSVPIEYSFVNETTNSSDCNTATTVTETTTNYVTVTVEVSTATTIEPTSIFSFQTTKTETALPATTFITPTVTITTTTKLTVTSTLPAFTVWNFQTAVTTSTLDWTILGAKKKKISSSSDIEEASDSFRLETDDDDAVFGVEDGVNEFPYLASSISPPWL